MMHEDEYQAASSEVALTLAANHVQGVWEERLPLAFDAAVTLGCVSELLPSMRHKPLSDTFTLADLKVPLPTTYTAYCLCARGWGWGKGGGYL